jgi:molybdate transport system substrate-binding protein
LAVAAGFLLTLAWAPHAAWAGETHVAVAANFTKAAKEIARGFEASTGHRAVLSFGSTGQLYTQIAKGAPFDVFLAADQARPEKAADEGLAMRESRFTYATGRIVLYSRDAGLVKGEATLRQPSFTRLAIANPLTAPYGAAAVQAMETLGVYDALSDRLVEGNNIAQTYQFVQTGNAELGFVALSQVVEAEGGSRWEVPQVLYSPISQDAVLLERGAANPAAVAFMDYLRGPEAREVITRLGYGPGS